MYNVQYTNVTMDDKNIWQCDNILSNMGHLVTVVGIDKTNIANIFDLNAIGFKY
jgi:hypothetical protein